MARPKRVRDRTGLTIASKTLERLLALPDSDLRNALGVAKEYADHSSTVGVGLSAGNRLLTQIEFGLKEIESTKGGAE
jgi:hypothetical protein